MLTGKFKNRFFDENGNLIIDFEYFRKIEKGEGKFLSGLENYWVDKMRGYRRIVETTKKEAFTAEYLFNSNGEPIIVKEIEEKLNKKKEEEQSLEPIEILWLQKARDVSEDDAKRHLKVALDIDEDLIKQYITEDLRAKREAEREERNEHISSEAMKVVPLIFIAAIVLIVIFSAGSLLNSIVEETSSSLADSMRSLAP